ncbi:MAG: CHAT domain-containing protein [Oscillatoria sp. SIO1A7]|nr:CHAT domain-containing protein [Oscillatoria sp. SIO1A7]
MKWRKQSGDNVLWLGWLACPILAMMSSPALASLQIGECAGSRNFGCNVFIGKEIEKGIGKGIGKEASAQEQARAEALFQRAQMLVKAGRFAEATGIWEQAASAFAQEGASLGRALSLVYLSLTRKQLGEWERAQEAIAASLEILELQSNFAPEATGVFARALNVQGGLYLAMGQVDRALEIWERAARTYQSAGDDMGSIGAEINQTQALQALGLYRRSRQLLLEINERLSERPDSWIKAQALHSLGQTLQVLGLLHESREILEQSLATASRLERISGFGSNNGSSNNSSILLSLGHTTRDLQDYPAALEFYQKAVVAAPTLLERVEAEVSQLNLLVEMEKWEQSESLLPQIQSQLVGLTPSRRAVYAAVHLGETALEYEGERWKEDRGTIIELRQGISQVLARAVRQAKEIRDYRAESYSLGMLGKLYARSGQWQEARSLTEKALGRSQIINASDLMALWQAQLGEIFKETGQIEEAIAAYSESVNYLESIRSDLVAINTDIQYDFRETVEPIYRQLVGLLLQSNASQDNLEKARATIEALQLAELDNFFREACLDAKPVKVDEIDQKAAVIYPIVLSDRLEVIVSRPGMPLRQYTARVSASKVEKTLRDMRKSLNPVFPQPARLAISRQIYDWSIRPAEANGDLEGVETLVFVLDGFWRNIPMSALYDGQQYLIKKYNVALTVGLQLLEPRAIEPESLRVMTGGLTEARQGFSPLPGVEYEVNQIAATLPSSVLLNREFTRATLQAKLQSRSFPVVHLATHGQFSSNAEETFLLAWDGRINVKDLDNLLQGIKNGNQQPIELLVLSACQTASGDDRAVLGLAGLALRAGARSTIATLWAVRDESTAVLMTEFYKYLNQPGNAKADALRQAQLALLDRPEYNHPFYWASVVLVGNWL